MASTRKVRSESMVQRMQKKPMSEGFELWDRGYHLGALRLLQFKSETSPPFQLAPCLDALACILECMDEVQDAADTYNEASGKYKMISQTIAGRLMEAKAIALTKGADAALTILDEIVKESDAEKDAATRDERTKQQLGKLYHFRAELLVDINPEQALEEARYSTTIGWDRVHLAHYTVAQLLNEKGDANGALASLKLALQRNAHHLASLELQLTIYRTAGNLEESLATVEKALAVHPKCDLIREKAYILSDLGRDAEAFQVCDEAIANPPHEETEAHIGGSGVVGVLLQAKAAILADKGQFKEASATLKKALDGNPNDEALQRMHDDIEDAYSVEYLRDKKVPQIMENVLAQILKGKPENPKAEMVKILNSMA